MKTARIIMATVVAILITFTTVLYTSCSRDACSGVTCLNGGACSHGNCLCPSGYTGNRCEYLSNTNITYYNNTFTPVHITINGSSATIASGSSVVYSGVPGDAAIGSASTAGTGGDVINFDLNDNFPNTANLEVDINVSSNYFYLEIANSSSYIIGQEYVNYQLSSQTYDQVTIPNDGNTYGVGYYPAYTNSNIYLLTAGGGHTWNYYNLNLPFTPNQYFVFTAL